MSAVAASAPVRPGTEWVSHLDYSAEHDREPVRCGGTLRAARRSGWVIEVECSGCEFEITTDDDTFRAELARVADLLALRESLWWNQR